MCVQSKPMLTTAIWPLHSSVKTLHEDSAQIVFHGKVRSPFAIGDLVL